ncbi:L-ribulose-5-phosphate 4-epimerase [Christensenellaceae bacterium OttesenSCG-928-M15]|nr:L-ribulose-5-phosphate 4-epimerase [Christensenellaceae bacterium OttesenSCG-928-M15]
MLEKLKQEVYEANMLLVTYGLVVLTWGNASAVSPGRKYIVIKPSGVDYALMTPEQMVVVDFEGNVVEGELRPSSDLETHIELYRGFEDVYGIVHTHSRFAVAFAQAGLDIPCYGTTHADYFYGPVPCTRPLHNGEITGAYEKNTGRVILETFRGRNIDENATPAVLVAKHGPFTWGRNVKKAAEHALILEEAARMTLMTKSLAMDAMPADKALMDKHYFRKHGKNAYYGQGNE